MRLFEVYKQRQNVAWAWNISKHLNVSTIVAFWMVYNTKKIEILFLSEKLFSKDFKKKLCIKHYNWYSHLRHGKPPKINVVLIDRQRSRLGIKPFSTFVVGSLNNLWRLVDYLKPFALKFWPNNWTWNVGLWLSENQKIV